VFWCEGEQSEDSEYSEYSESGVLGMVCRKYNVKVEKHGGGRSIVVVERGVAYSICTSFKFGHKKSGVAF